MQQVGVHHILINAVPRTYVLIFSVSVSSGNRTPRSMFYSDLLDTLPDSVCIHQLVLKRRSKR